MIQNIKIYDIGIGTFTHLYLYNILEIIAWW